jgi:AraC-like DNA-binding protein
MRICWSFFGLTGDSLWTASSLDGAAAPIPWDATGAGEMYQNGAASPRETSRVDPGTTLVTLVPVAARALETASTKGSSPGLPEVRSDPELSPRQLRSVIAELVTALSSTLNDERDSAKECLSRVAAVLQSPEDPEKRARDRMKGGLAPWQIRKVTSHIETNLDKSIKSGDLAALLDLNPCHFSRAFRNTFGNSPLEYVIRRRMERAQGLMLSTDAPLSQIALECGLADQAHFSRLFRRTVGESPRAWRRARVSPCAGNPFADATTTHMRPRLPNCNCPRI